jgi:hypothetical protein
MVLIEHKWHFAKDKPITFAGIFDSTDEFERRRADWLRTERGLVDIDWVVVRSLGDEEYKEYLTALKGEGR